jgi:predicted ATP-grasp superfamily ATP-dependent carboligase
VVRDGFPYAVEVNPRWTASMELVERAAGQSVLALHADACGAGVLPPADFLNALPRRPATGKAIVYARAGIIVGNTDGWLERPDRVRDVPRPGEQVPAGAPVCTVFASAADAAACREALAAAAADVYEEMAEWTRV